MKPKVTTTPTDMDKFISIFQGERVKQLSNGLEVRSRNLDRDLHHAKHIIQSNGLALIAHTQGNMASMSCFMVEYTTN